MAVKGAGQGFGPGRVGVHRRQVAEPFLEQRLGHHFAHLAGADQQSLGARKVAVQVLRQPGRGGGDGDRALTDLGFRTHPLGGRVGALQDGLQSIAG